jgi:hypothetical protein
MQSLTCSYSEEGQEAEWDPMRLLEVRVEILVHCDDARHIALLESGETGGDVLGFLEVMGYLLPHEGHWLAVLCTGAAGNWLWWGRWGWARCL